MNIEIRFSWENMVLIDHLFLMKGGGMKLLASVPVLLFTVWSVHSSVYYVPGDFPTIQAAVDASSPGDRIYLSAGTFTGEGNTSIFLNGKALEIMSIDGPDMTIIDCQGDSSAMVLNHMEPSGTLIEGLTLMNASTGAVIVWQDSEPSIINCHIANNRNSVGHGGGIWSFGGSPLVYRCVITGNSSTDFGYGCGGAGIDSYAGSPKVIDCRVENNFIEMVNHGTDKVYHAAGIYHEGSPCELSNSLISSNFMTGDPGPGSHVWGGAVSGGWTITNCTVTGNNSSGGIGGIDGECTVQSSIVLDNTGDQISTGLNVTYSDIGGGYPGTGNIDADPLFVGGPLGLFYLSRIESGQAEDSPCIDSGHADASLVCFPVPDGQICMDEGTTRTDHLRDDQTVDMGYHYFPVTAGPTWTSTAVPTATPSPVPSSTASPAPSSTPEWTATPTGTPPSWNGVRLALSGEVFESGDLFFLEAFYRFPEHIPSADMYLVLEAFGLYYFWPSWAAGIDREEVVHPSVEPGYIIILSFDWPEGDFGTADGLGFWSLLTVSGTYDVMGEIAHLSFSYR